MTDFETCSWCTIEVPFSEIENHETSDGALLCNVCWKEYRAA